MELTGYRPHNKEKHEQVMALVKESLTDREIAGKLGLSDATVSRWRQGVVKVDGKNVKHARPGRPKTVKTVKTVKAAPPVNGIYVVKFEENGGTLMYSERVVRVVNQSPNDFINLVHSVLLKS